MDGQEEPHVKLEFIKYPRFEMEPSLLKNEIQKLTEYLMSEFGQNIIVIVYHDEIVMIENNASIDPRISIK